MSYTYGDTSHKHAVTALSNGNSYSYDANGNMTTRTIGGQTFNLSYDGENRLVSVSGAATASFVYNGDSQRVKSTVGGVTTIFVGNYYEWHGNVSTSVSYYYAGSSRVAMKTGSGPTHFLLGDHLGSTSLVVDGSGQQQPGSPQGYLPWGETRFGGVGTKYQYTGQFNETSLGLYYYGARWYDASLGRFITADTVIPEVSQGVQAWDRYGGMNNNPISYNDPSGHDVGCAGKDASECFTPHPSQKNQVSCICTGMYCGFLYGSVVIKISPAPPEPSYSYNPTGQNVSHSNFRDFPSTAQEPVVWGGNFFKLFNSIAGPYVPRPEATVEGYLSYSVSKENALTFTDLKINNNTSATAGIRNLKIDEKGGSISGTTSEVFPIGEFTNPGEEIKYPLEITVSLSSLISVKLYGTLYSYNIIPFIITFALK